MADEGPQSVETPQKVEARAAEAAAIRRRWITLGEILAVVAVLISAGTLWLNWSERREDIAARVSETRKASGRATLLVLQAQADGKDRLALKPAAPDQVVQGQIIRFPTVLGIDPVETTGDPRIEVRWFEKGLKRAREEGGLPDDSRGDERLPIVVETRFLADGTDHMDIALYDIGYSIAGRMLSGHEVLLRGLSFVKRAGHGNAQAQINARWARFVPVKSQ